ncbi:MAG: sodium:solute symporter family protein [Candidatus Methanospirareceae archaeon]
MIAPVHLYTAVGVFFLCMVIIAHYGHVKTGKGVEEYYIAGRKSGGLVSALTYSATTYSSFMLVGLVGFTWAGGVGALGFELTYLMGTALLLVIFAPRFLLAGRRWGYVTPTELLSHRYENRAVGIIATLLCLTFLIPYISVQATGSAYLMSMLTGGGIPAYQAGLFVIVVFIAVLAWWGGMRGVAWSDAAQALVMLVTSTALLFFLVHLLLGGWSAFFTTLETEYPTLLTTPGPNAYFNFPKFLGLTLPWFFFALTNPQVSQRLFIPKSLKSARTMIWGFLIFGFIYTVISTLFGLMGHVLYPALADPDLVMPTLLAEKTPAIAALLITLGILAAAVTTANSIILTLGSMVARDVYKAVGISATELREMQVGRSIILVMAAALIAFSWRPFGLIVELSVLSSAGLLALVPSLIGAFFWRKATAVGALASMIIGGLVIAALYFGHLYPLGQWPGIWGFLCTTVTFIVVSWVTKAPAHADAFFDALDDDLRAKNIINA